MEGDGWPGAWLYARRGEWRAMMDPEIYDLNILQERVRAG